VPPVLPSMRNSANEHNRIWPVGPLAVLSILLLQPCALSSDQNFRISNEDMIAIHADTGWEDTEPDTVHFSGHFEMRVRDLRLTADRATLRGPLNDPERLELEGAPARIGLFQTVANRKEKVQAEARSIVYDRETDSMRLTGDARLSQGDNVLLSNNIEYDIASDRFRTEGRTGIQIKVPSQP